MQALFTHGQRHDQKARRFGLVIARREPALRMSENRLKWLRLFCCSAYSRLLTASTQNSKNGAHHSQESKGIRLELPPQSDDLFALAFYAKR